MVFIGGSWGAISRYTLSNMIKRFVSITFPIATFLINLIGSFLIGIVLSSQLGHYNQLLLATGFMGGFTTFSTFQIENIALYQTRNFKSLTIYIFLSYFFCILFAILGLIIGMTPTKIP